MTHMSVLQVLHMTMAVGRMSNTMSVMTAEVMGLNKDPVRTPSDASLSKTVKK